MTNRFSFINSVHEYRGSSQTFIDVFVVSEEDFYD